MTPVTPPVLTASDPAPVELVNLAGKAPLILVCEHGGRAIPHRLGADAPPAEDMARHIAYDVGAAAVARTLAERLDAPLALQPFSRLVIDCNRPRQASDLAPAVSDGSAIPFNQGIDDDARDARWQAIHQPFHRAVAELVDARDKPALVAVHSFARRLRDQPPRRMAIGLLARQDKTFARTLRDRMLPIEPDLDIVFDAPYRIEDDSDYTIPIHGEPRSLPHVLLEIRNDLIADATGIERMAALLSAGLSAGLSAVLDTTATTP